MHGILRMCIRLCILLEWLILLVVAVIWRQRRSFGWHTMITEYSCEVAYI